MIQSGLIEEYVLGLCGDDERAKVEAIAQKDEEIAKLIRELQNAMEDYCQSMHRPIPSRQQGNVGAGSMKSGKRQPIGGSAVSAGRRSRWSWGGPVAAGLAAMLFVATVYLFNENHNLEKELMQLTIDKRDLAHQVSALEHEAHVTQKKVNFLQDLQTAHVHLLGTGMAPEALAVVYWNEDRQEAVLKVVALPEPPQDMTYQLWADVDGVMKDMGVLTQPRGSWIVVPFMHHAASLNVTLEEAGGSVHPTVERLVVSGQI